MDRNLIAAGLIAGLLTTPALADNLSSQFAAESAYQRSWTSFSVGVGAGLGSVNTEVDAQPGTSVNDPGADGATAHFDSLGSSGGFVSVSGGADYQALDRIVIGTFVDGDFTDLSSEVHVEVPGAPLDIAGSVSINNKVSVGARIGYLVWPTSLWYVSAGYTRVDFDSVKLTVTSNDPTVAGAIDVPALSGIFIGLGSETLLTGKMSLKAEFRYTDFGSGKLSFPTVDGTNLNDFVDAHVSPSMQEGRLSINYRID